MTGEPPSATTGTTRNAAPLGCAAPWSDLLVSSADNRTNNCCEYTGPAAATFRPDGSLRSVVELWNGPEILAIRRIQAGRTRLKGCTGCPFSLDTPAEARQSFYEFYTPDSLTERQQANLDLARQERQAGLLRLTALPVRYVLFFGWFCNLSCPICNQLPHRDGMPATLPASLLDQWLSQFAVATRVECIGGEVFAIPSALAFMRAFVAVPELAPVRLRITTNGTLLHKHLDWLKAKERLSVNISIDSIGPTYERVRVDGKWDQVKKNILTTAGLIRDHRPHWDLETNALISKSVIPALPDYARFHTEHGVTTYFQIPNFTRGNEEVLYREDILRFPALLREIPGWQDAVAEAIALFDGAGATQTATQLRNIFAPLQARSQTPDVQPNPFGRKIAEASGTAGCLGLIAGTVGNDTVTPDLIDGLPGFTSGDPHFGLIVRLDLGRLDLGTARPGDGTIGIRLVWPATLPAQSRYCHTTLYDAQRFRLLSWTEHRADGERIIELVARSPAPGASGPSGPILLTLMNARMTARNILPHRLEIWTVGDPKGGGGFAP